MRIANQGLPIIDKSHGYDVAAHNPVNQKNLEVELLNQGPKHMEMLKDIYGEKRLKQMSLMPCVTCESRVYQDASDDPGVSFKSPQHVSPEASYSAVLSHEMEHVSREQNSAEAENREVISQSVILHRSMCAECGKSYVAGGVTRTTTAAEKPKADPYKSLASEDQLGAYVDFKL